MKFTGLDLTGIDPSTIQFCYIGLDGTKVIAECNSLKVDVKKGTFTVTGAKLPHFLRYGWTRTGN